MISQDEYAQILYQLLPQGPAWPQAKDGSIASDFIQACAYELSDVEVALNELYKELNPSTTVTYLDIWLKEWGLPDDCMKLLGDTDFPQDKLQQALAAKYASWGLGFKDALYAIANAFGYKADIERVDPFLVTSTVDSKLYDYKWAGTALIITTDLAGQTEYFLTTWTVDQPLARWGDRVYECMVRKIIPAHLFPMFTYPDE